MQAPLHAAFRLSLQISNRVSSLPKAHGNRRACRERLMVVWLVSYLRWLPGRNRMRDTSSALLFVPMTNKGAVQDKDLGGHT